MSLLILLEPVPGMLMKVRSKESEGIRMSLVALQI